MVAVGGTLGLLAGPLVLEPPRATGPTPLLRQGALDVKAAEEVEAVVVKLAAAAFVPSVE